MTSMREALSNGQDHTHGGWSRTGGVRFFSGDRLAAYRCGASTCGHEVWQPEGLGQSNPPLDPGTLAEEPRNPVQRKEAVDDFIRQVKMAGQDRGLMVSGGGGPTEEGREWLFALRVRFPENEPGTPIKGSSGLDRSTLGGG